MSLLPPSFANSSTPYYVLADEAPGFTQVLSLSGDVIALSNGGGSVNVATATAVALTTDKTTAMTYDSGLASTTFDGQVVLPNPNGETVIQPGVIELARAGSNPVIEFSRSEIVGVGTFGFDGSQFVFNPPIPGGLGPTGPQGVQGPQGNQGADGIAGPTGPQGIEGPEGPAGLAGATGAQGPAGSNGAVGATGPQGSQGLQGNQGIQGVDGPTGPQGLQGLIGPAGADGVTGAQGPAGSNGAVGATGPQGPQGLQGPQGIQGDIGPTGVQGNAGADGASSSFYNYKADTTTQAPPISNGRVVWDNAVQTDSSNIYLSHLTDSGDDIDVFLSLLKVNDAIILQAQLNSGQNQKLLVRATPTVLENQYTLIPVTFVTSAGGAFSNNDSMLVIVASAGAVGPTGPQGVQGNQGVAGATGPQGVQGSAGADGAVGPTGLQGPAGSNGAVGATGPQGGQGIQGIQGNQGIDGPTGPQGVQGPAGSNGLDGPTGPQGSAGTNGLDGPTGPEGLQGIQGIQGTQGIQGDVGPTGIQGIQGIQGPQGLQGNDGPTGPAGGGAPGAPGGGNRDIQYNNSGEFAGDGGLTYNSSGRIVSLTNVDGDSRVEVFDPTNSNKVEIKSNQINLKPSDTTRIQMFAGDTNSQIVITRSGNGNNTFISSGSISNSDGSTFSSGIAYGAFTSSDSVTGSQCSLTAVGMPVCRVADAQLSTQQNASSFEFYDPTGLRASISYDSSGLVFNPPLPSGGGGEPAGANTELQFNAGSAFGASSDLTFADSRLQVVGGIDISGTEPQLNINGTAPQLNMADASGNLFAIALDATPQPTVVFTGQDSASMIMIPSGVAFDFSANVINIDAVMPRVQVSDGSENSALHAGYVSASLQPVLPDQLCRKDYVDQQTGFSPENMFYVAKNGSDLTGNGSFLRPWLTIQYAIDQIEAIPPTAVTQAVINVAPGDYVEDLIFTTGYIHVISPFNMNDVNEVAQLTGTVSIAITTGANDKFNKQVGFQGIQINGRITDTSTREHTVMIQDCYLFGDNSNGGQLLRQASTVDCRTRIYNCEINSDSSQSFLPCFHISRGDSYFDRLDLTYNGRAPVLRVDASGAVFANSVDFTNTSYATDASGFPLVYLNSVNASAFGSCLFRYSRTTVGRTNGNGYFCLKYDSPTLGVSAGAGVAVVFSSFVPNGSGPSVMGSNGTGSGVNSALIAFGNNLAAPGGASSIAGSLGVNKVPYTTVS